MIRTKRKSSVYYPIKKYYKRRLMVGDVLTNRTLHIDFPDDFVNKTDFFDQEQPQRDICRYNNSSAGSFDKKLIEFTDYGSEYGIYVGPTALRKTIYFYNSETNKSEVNKNEYKMSSSVQDVTEITDCRAYRHIYIEDLKIRPLQQGDALKEGTKLYFTIPDDISEKYTAYKNPSSTLTDSEDLMPSAVEPDSEITLTLMDRFLSIVYYNIIGENSTRIVDITLKDGGSNINIFKSQHDEEPTINLSSYIVTNPEIITNYEEFDFWSQFILVDTTTLAEIRPFLAE